ncbi:MAG: ECF transporter S component, partial [Lachnospiraceae bacterium]|nr:ECF transporter S component [Lachnospiraceae bacterium]
MQNVSAFRLTRAALMMALTTIATMILQVPIPAAGYVNLGDCFVLLCGIFLGPVYGGLAAGLGAGLADLLSGFVIYAPATFIIKGLCAVVMAVLLKRDRREKNMVLPVLFSGIISELGMVLG